MNKFPKHYSLIHEKPDHFMIHDQRDGKAFPIAKKSLHPATQMHMLRLPKFAEGGEAEKDDEYLKAFNAQAAKDYDKGMNQSESRGPSVDEWAKLHSDSAPPSPVDQPQDPPPMMEAQAPMEQQAPIQPQQTQEPQPTPQPQEMNLNASTQGYPTVESLNKATNQEASGIQMQAQGQMAQNKALANAQEQRMAIDNLHNETFNQKLDKQQQQYDIIFKQVADGKINPDQYWDNHSRIGAALAVLVSGIGAGLQHSTQNMALGVIQNGIDKSIEAQKAELGKKENLLSHNLRAQGSLIQAENEYRLQASAAFQGKLMQIANETGDPIIQGQAQQKIAQIRLATLPMQQQLAQHQTQLEMRKQLIGGNLSPDLDPAQLVPHVVPEHHQAKVNEEIALAQHTSKNSPDILSAFDRAAKNVHLADFNPMDENADQKALHAMLGPTFKDVEGTVRQAAMDNMAKYTTPQFGDNANTINTKREALVHYLNSKAAAPTAKGYGIDLTKFNSTRPAQSAPEVKTMGGVPYVKVNGGWKKQ